MPTTLEMNTTRPLRARSMPRAARLATRNAPVRFVSTTSVKSDSAIRNRSVSRVMPALATRTSTGPWVASTSSKAASTDAVSVTSHRTPDRPSGGSPLRYVTVTASPASANARAIARPIPRFPPVTKTDRLTCELLSLPDPRRRYLIALPRYFPPISKTTSGSGLGVSARVRPGIGERGTSESRTGPTRRDPNPNSGVFEAESHLHADLQVLDIAVHDLAADLGDLEPVEVPERLRRPVDAVAHRFVDALGGRPDDLGHPVRAIHVSSFVPRRARRVHRRAHARDCGLPWRCERDARAERPSRRAGGLGDDGGRGSQFRSRLAPTALSGHDGHQAGLPTP